MTKMRESVICIGKCLQIADIESSNVCVTNGSLTDYNGRNEGSLMPLRDHFRPPYSKLSSWEGFHGVWPAMMVQQLNDALPASFVAEPRVHLGTNFEIDVKESELDSPRSSPAIPAHTDGGVSTATYAPPKPTLTIEAELGPEYEYAVEVYDLDRGRHLVAAVEIVSPGNKDRPENRRAFVAKCEALLRRNVCVCPSSISCRFATSICSTNFSKASINRWRPRFQDRPCMPSLAEMSRRRDAGG